MQPQTGKVIAAYEADHHGIGLAVIIKANQIEVVGQHVRECVRLVAQVAIVKVGKPGSTVVDPAFGLTRDQHELVSVGDRQRTKEKAVQGTEDRGVRADAKRQGDNGNRGHDRILDEHASAEAHVLKQSIHGKTPLLSDGPFPDKGNPAANRESGC